MTFDVTQGQKGPQAENIVPGLTPRVREEAGARRLRPLPAGPGLFPQVAASFRRPPRAGHETWTTSLAWMSHSERPGRSQMVTTT